MSLVRITRELSRELGTLTFGAPVTHVYDPLQYAQRSAEAYLKRYGTIGVENLLLGMNPGPFGMAQTGVPFGEVSFARDWLGLAHPVGRPKKEHPKRPITGFECTRSEVSGHRVWSWAKERFLTPEAFFERFFVWNYCPLVFLEESGRNRTPDKLAQTEREALHRLCDEALVRTVRFLKPRRVIGIGKFAEGRAKKALGTDGPQIGTILHPSPASPLANQGWAPQAEAQLRALGVTL